MRIEKALYMLGREKGIRRNKNLNLKKKTKQKHTGDYFSLSSKWLTCFTREVDVYITQED